MRSKPLAVQIPPPEANQPSWTRVGVIAVVGFAVGIAWPKIVGVRLGPSAPAEALSALAARAPEAPPSASAAQAAVAVTAAASGSVTPVAAPPKVHVGRAIVLSCKTDAGDTLKRRDCGTLLGLDAIVQARIQKLTAAPVAAQNPGKLNVILGLDFGRNRVSVESGKSSSVKDPGSLKAVLAGEFKTMSLKSVAHDNPRYTVLYVVHIETEGGESTSPAASGSTPAAVTATPSHARGGTPAGAAAADLPDGVGVVAWDVAIIRDAPHTGKIIARLPRGTRVQLGKLEAGWYPIHFGDKNQSEGWVYRGALGK